MTGLAAWFWADVWPNLVASGICTAIVWWRARIHLSRHRDTRDTQHQQILEALTSQTGGGSPMSPDDPPGDPS